MYSIGMLIAYVLVYFQSFFLIIFFLSPFSRIFSYIFASSNIFRFLFYFLFRYILDFRSLCVNIVRLRHSIFFFKSFFHRTNSLFWFLFQVFRFSSYSKQSMKLLQSWYYGVPADVWFNLFYLLLIHFKHCLAVDETQLHYLKLFVARDCYFLTLNEQQNMEKK